MKYKNLNVTREIRHQILKDFEAIAHYPWSVLEKENTLWAQLKLKIDIQDRKCLTSEWKKKTRKM